jgi:hypothetical protein
MVYVRMRSSYLEVPSLFSLIGSYLEAVTYHSIADKEWVIMRYNSLAGWHILQHYSKSATVTSVPAFHHTFLRRPLLLQCCECTHLRNAAIAHHMAGEHLAADEHIKRNYNTRSLEYTYQFHQFNKSSTSSFSSGSSRNSNTLS